MDALLCRTEVEPVLSEDLRVTQSLGQHGRAEEPKSPAAGSRPSMLDQPHPLELSGALKFHPPPVFSQPVEPCCQDGRPRATRGGGGTTTVIGTERDAPSPGKGRLQGAASKNKVGEEQIPLKVILKVDAAVNQLFFSKIIFTI